MPHATETEPLPHLTVRAALTSDLPTRAPEAGKVLLGHTAQADRARVRLRPRSVALRRRKGLAHMEASIGIAAVLFTALSGGAPLRWLAQLVEACR